MQKSGFVFFVSQNSPKFVLIFVPQSWIIKIFPPPPKEATFCTARHVIQHTEKKPLAKHVFVTRTIYIIACL